MENGLSSAEMHETGPTRENGYIGTDRATSPIEMADVYGEVEDLVTVWLSDDTDNSLIVDDAPTIDGGTFNVVIENQGGRPVLHAWREQDFGNDPWLSVYLDTGEPRWS